MTKAVIAGAGPVGALTAIFLAREGYSVDVFERRACPEVIPPSTDAKAYLLNLNVRAFKAFKAAGISVDALLKRCNGRSEFSFRDAKGKEIAGVNMPVTPEDPSMIRVYRDEISRHLIDEAKRLHPEAITFHFNAGVAGADFEKKVVTISGQTPQEMQYDLLVGADGAGSVVRAALQKIMPPDFLLRKTHTAVYATGPLHITKKEDFPSHTFTSMDSFKEGAIMVYGRGNGDFRVGIFIDKFGAQKLKEGNDGWLQDSLDTSMPMLLDDATSSAKKLAADPPEFSPVSGWTYLSQFHGPRVILLGDAAHTMTPMLGQGCNSGLEDAHLFAKALQEHKDLDTALSAYTEARLPDMKALIRLNEIFAAGRFTSITSEDQGAGSLTQRLSLLTHTAILGTQYARMALHRQAPSIFGMPPMFKAMFGTGPFRKVMPAAYRDTASLLFVSALLGGALYRLSRRS